MATALKEKSTEINDEPECGIVANSDSASRDSPGVSALSDLFACPSCASNGVSYSKRRNALSCSECSLRFPVFQCGKTQIPWLFAEPTTTRLEWKARYHGFLHENSQELERLREARSEGQSSKIGQQRITHLLHAREAHRNQISEILAPLNLDGIEWPVDSASLLHGKLPRSQGISSYINNVFRDWAWDNGENEAMLAAVEKVIDAAPDKTMGTALTLGAGACRLSYDLHRRYRAERSVVLDFNPLLLHIASAVMQGREVPLYEFPLAPLNAESFAVLQRLTAPVPLEYGDFNFVLADALNLPFAASSFDTVVTPWLIDIVPQDLRTFIPQINRCLIDGGTWVNTGSLAFFHKDESWRYSEEEVLELLQENGFEVIAAERQTVSYLQSPHSGYGRYEKIFSFSARKIKSVEVPTPSAYLPTWILDTSRPVPASNETAISSSHHLLKAQVLATIDGKRTIRQISRILARQYGLGKQETIHAVQRILIDAWEQSGVGDSGKDL